MASKDIFNFEKAFSELEVITEEFEKGEIDIETGLKKFERGLELAEQLKKRLGEIENKVIEIKGRFKDLEKGAENGDE